MSRRASRAKMHRRKANAFWRGPRRRRPEVMTRPQVASRLAFGSGDTHGHCPASPPLWIPPTPRFAFALPRSPKFPTELSPRVLRLCPVCSPRPMPIGRFARASPLVMAGQQKCTVTRLCRRFTCVRTHGFVRRDSRTSVALRTARPPTHITTCL